ncbi:MAG: hypothetical protein PF450_00270 [Bacteroidales bacterium]|jgi:hypothetical protein|nr:hypothetical protein [Bacteroidales bacterium]
MDAIKAQQILDDCQKRHHILTSQLKDVGFVWPGSLVSRYLTCGKANCACHKDPAFRHGPYLYWSTKVGGKTVSKTISGSKAQIVQQWIANRIELESIIEQMKEVSQDAFKAASFLMSENKIEDF